MPPDFGFFLIFHSKFLFLSFCHPQYLYFRKVCLCIEVPFGITFLFALLILLCSSPVMSLFLFLSSSLYLASLVCSCSVLVSLLLLLVYLGGLIVLFAYLWIFISYSSPLSPHLLFLIMSPFITFYSSASSPSSLSPLLSPSSFLLFLASFLFLVLLAVVVVIDPSLGSFST